VISGRAVTWFSTAQAVATVTPIGVSPFATFLAKAAGTTTIRATVDGITAEITVTVTAGPPPADQLWYLFFAGSNRGIWTNQLIDMRQFLTGYGPNGTVANPAVVWSIDDPAIAAIDENGNVRGLTKGTTRVRATAGNVVATTLVTVYQPMPGPVVYDLTYDWWTGEWHMPPTVGTETWTDGNGVDHQVEL
jgi:alpha-amylase